MSDTGGQHKRQYDWLKQYQFQKGQSGNPSGGQKGKSLKTFVREIFEKMSDEDKAKFLKKLDPDLIWRMGEGQPRQDTDVTSDGKAITISFDSAFKDRNATPWFSKDCRNG